MRTLLAISLLFNFGAYGSTRGHVKQGEAISYQEAVEILNGERFWLSALGDDGLGPEIEEQMAIEDAGLRGSQKIADNKE